MWKRAVSREAAEFWEDEFKTPAMNVRLHLKSLGEEVDGDAPIEHNGTQASTTTSPPAAVGADDVSVRTPPKLRQGGANPQQHQSRKRAVENEYKFNANRRRKRLCLDFQSGCCSDSKPGSAACPDDPELRHQCAKCLSFEHGADQCGVAGPGAWKAKGGGKGKVKGKKEGKGGNHKKRSWRSW